MRFLGYCRSRSAFDFLLMVEARNITPPRGGCGFGVAVETPHFYTPFLPTSLRYRHLSHIFDKPCRHAPRRPGNLPGHTSSQASDDVLRYFGEGYPSNMQKIYGAREYSVFFRSIFVSLNSIP